VGLHQPAACQGYASNMEERKCYTMWFKMSNTSVAGGKVVWHTADELVLLTLKHSNLLLKSVPKGEWPELEKYNHQRVDLE